MPLKFLVSNADEPSSTPDTFVFRQERIVIGRDSANDLPLNDFKRVVSKQHAEIVARGGMIQLTDLGSKNFTYLNGERLKSGQPYPIQAGDAIRIGDFEITFEAFVEEAPAPVPSYGADRTVFDVSYVNPFEESVKVLALTLRSLVKEYEAEAPTRRDDALEEAIGAAMEGDAGRHAVYGVVARLLAPQEVARPPAPPPETPPPSVKAPPAVKAPPLHDFTATPPPVAPPPSRVVASPDAARLHRAVDTVLRAVARLIGGPWQFRHEFIGQTIMQSEETAFLYEGNPEVLKRHVLDPTLTEDEAAHRLRLLEEAIEDVAMHQVAMLDGYKAGVREGAMRLIDQLNPDALEEEAAQKSWLHRFVAPLAKAEALSRLRDQLRELRSEDWTASERRTYRPAFIKAYLARMTAARRPEAHFEEP